MKFPRKTHSVLIVLAMTALAAIVVWQMDGSSESDLNLLSKNWQKNQWPESRSRIQPDRTPQSVEAGDASRPTPELRGDSHDNGTSGITPTTKSATEPIRTGHTEPRLRTAAANQPVADVQPKPNGGSSIDRREVRVTRSERSTLDAPDPAERISPEQLQEVKRLIEQGNDLAAHRHLSLWYWKFPHDRSQFQQQLDELAQSIYFSPQPHYAEAYMIQPGDQLRKIARNYRLSWQYLARLNRVNPRKIRAGQKLKVVQGPFDAVVDLSDYELTVVCQKQFVRRYAVGIGKDGTSPIGKFTVKDKLEDPVYYGPDGVIANDDPENPLGERWIDIGDSFGIHGTIDPNSIGKSESRGCIRMLNDDVEEVYDFLTVGSTVWIRR